MGKTSNDKVLKISGLIETNAKGEDWLCQLIDFCEKRGETCAVSVEDSTQEKVAQELEKQGFKHDHDMSREQLCKQALEKWGSDLQLLMVIEECAELQQAISKFWRATLQWKTLNIKRIIKEACDVELMLKQIEVMYPGEDWAVYRKYADVHLENLLAEEDTS